MFGYSIPAGFLFYGKIRRRMEVAFDFELRELTRQTAHSVRSMILSGQTPLAGYEPKRCDACSLIELCPTAVACSQQCGQRLAAEAT